MICDVVLIHRLLRSDTHAHTDACITKLWNQCHCHDSIFKVLLTCLFETAVFAHVECCVHVCFRGTAISGIVFGVVFLMGAVAALFLCVCMCLKNGQGARVGVFNTSFISTVTQGYPGWSAASLHTNTPTHTTRLGSCFGHYRHKTQCLHSSPFY